MKRSGVCLAKILSTAAAAASILWLQSAGWAQSLTASANPPSGGAGVNDSYLTGSGFPAGAITGATVHFGTSCAAPAAASGPVIQVTTQGVLRRFEFLIPASLNPGSYQVWVSGTAGTTAFNTVTTPSCSAITVTASVTGTASLGAPIVGGAVTLVDANGNTATGATASDGTYTLSSAGLTPPYLVRVVTASASGAFPAHTTLYSVSADGNASTHINVHVLSDLILRSFYSAQGIDPDNAFSSPTGPNAAPTPVAVQSLASLVIPAVQLWLTDAGVNATPGPPANGAINLISSPFTAYPAGVTPTGLDAVLHLITSEIIDPGNVTSVTITNSPITETITPSYSSGDVTLNTVTTNATTHASTNESFTGLVITSANQSVVSGIDATLVNLASIVNTHGSALTGAELLPIYAPDYINDGENATLGAEAFAAQIAGITVYSLQVQSLNSLNTTTHVADVIVAYNITQGGVNQSGTIEWFFQLQSGTWLMYGDQQIASLELGVGGRHYEGTGGNFVGNILEVGVSAPVGTISAASVTSSLSIWQAGNGTTNTTNLAPEPTQVSFPVNLENFGADSVPLLPFPQYVVPTGTPFTFTVTPVSGPAVQYTAHTNADTTETITITSPSATGLANAHLGSPLLVEWTLPTTFTITSIDVDGVTFNGPENSSSTLECDNDVNPGTNATSVYITMPATCGGSPVVNAWVRVSIGGLSVSTGAWFFF